MENEWLNWQGDSPLVINLHITKHCNMKCRFCFGGFECVQKGLTVPQWCELIEKLAHETQHIPNKRLNFAGGEPLLFRGLSQLIQVAHEKGFDVSLITNGALLTASFIDETRPFLTSIGISIDSLIPEINQLSGRQVCGKALTSQDYYERCRLVKEAGLKLKVNTLIHRLNASQDFAPLLQQVEVDRWKVLRMLAIKNENAQGIDLLPSDEAFETFVRRHQAYHPIVENDDDIQEAYFFVSPDGQLMDNSDHFMKPVADLRTEPLKQAIQKLQFNWKSYHKRYQTKKDEN